MKVEGLEELVDKLNMAGVNTTHVLEKAMLKGMKETQTAAKLRCPVNHGELRDRGIKAGVFTDGAGTINGSVFTNTEYAPYVEFGTGPVGEANHSGISPYVQPTYTHRDHWWFPVKNMADAKYYGWVTVTLKDGTVLARTKGQKAQPFLWPAAEAMRPRVVQILGNELRKQWKQISEGTG